MDESYHSSTSFLLIRTSNFYLKPGTFDYQRVVEFGGVPVPEGGLVLSPPLGGELTVWPDGQYAFSCPVPIRDGLPVVATHYSYVAETQDGVTTMGSFSLGEQIQDEIMPDFQAWSMQDILALEDNAELFADAHGADALVGSDCGPEAGDLSFDILDHVIKTSFES